MRIGIFGGTFDPVHLGHLVLAEQCREQGHLDQVWFVPANQPPNKLEQKLTRFEQRCEMLQLAIAGNPVFRIETLEKEREGPSYTVDTLQVLHQRYPGNDYWYLMGSDTLLDLPNWYHPERLVTLAGLMVRTRPGSAVLGVEELKKKIHLSAKEPIRMAVIESPMLEISSSDLRKRVSEGKSLRYMVPRSVEAYIESKKLYQNPKS